MRPDYILRPLTRADLPMVAAWLQADHMLRWWGDPAEQLALVAEDLDQPLMDQQIASLGAVPFGYLQSYPVHVWPDGAPHLADFPAGTMAIDCFIGRADMLGQGHGAAMLRHYAQKLLQQAPCVVIDPDPENDRGKSVGHHHDGTEYAAPRHLAALDQPGGHDPQQHAECGPR